MGLSRLLVSTVTFLVCVMAVPLFGALAGRLGLNDAPGPLKIHTLPIPRTGGIGIFVALMAGLAVVGISKMPGAWSFLVALAAVWLIGLIDDLRGLSVYFRLVAEAGAAFFLWRAGWRLPVVENSYLSFAATALFIIFIINAFNMLDGADGLAAGVTGIIALGYIWPGWTPHSSITVMVACGLMASCAGFLLSNFPPAKLFLGDSGSTMLGFAVAFLVLDSYHSAPLTFSGFVAPLLFAGLPLLDAVNSILRRLLTGKSPFVGDRGHLYDVLLLDGWRPRTVAYVYYVLTIVVVTLGRMYLKTNSTLAIVLPLLGLILLWAAVNHLRVRQVTALSSVDSTPR